MLADGGEALGAKARREVFTKIINQFEESTILSTTSKIWIN